MSKHTPGPWKAINTEGPWIAGGDSGTVEAVTPDGRYVRREVCSFYLDTDEDLQEDLANARLIAAAPLLLEACEEAHGWLDSMGDAGECPHSAYLAGKLKAAIAAATGGPADV